MCITDKRWCLVRHALLLAGLAMVFGAGSTMVRAEPPSSQPAASVAVRGWILLVYDMPYLREVIKKAPAYGINQIQLSHEIVHFADQVLDDPQRQKDVQELVALGKSLGLEMYIWTHELHSIPDRFAVGVNKRIDLDDPSVWQFITNRYRKLYEVVPDLDGVVVSFSETGPAALTDETGVMSKLFRQRRIAMIGSVLNAVHQGLGKHVVFRDFGETLWEREGIRICPPGIWAMTKVVFGDWHPYGEPSITYDYYGQRPLLVEFDLCGEYLGQGVIPWCDPAYVKFRWQQALDRTQPYGAVGRIGRTEFHRDGHPAFGTPNEVNIEMFCRLLQDPRTKPEDVWRDWTRKTYGHKAAPLVESALKRSATFTKWLYWGEALGDYRIEQHSYIPTFAYALSHDVEYMQTYPIDAEMFLRHDGMIESEMNRRYDAALQQMGLSFADIERAKPHLDPKQYEDLKRRLEMASLTGLAFKQVHTAFIRYRAIEFGMHHRDMYASQTDHLLAAVDHDYAELEETAKYIEEHFGPALDIASAERIRTFATGLRDSYDQLKASGEKP